MAPPKTKAPSKAKAKAETESEERLDAEVEARVEAKSEAKTAPAPRAEKRLKVIDNPTITEQFANQVLDVLLVNGSTVSITMGAKRNIRDAIFGERETVVAVNTRLTVDVQTAEALRNALNRVLLMAKQGPGTIN
ncbi:hypothetical protein [Microvirga pudoricolor]|uniref:hypothetical protein n=1 Tax=Microvirga pudoricolor TaxID=2778729 RepID=UPI0019513497|nr:hypothetical protein [Microvirga pudoricolor]MBM6594181.1 hypothetical protein [Microvirga pudoricolor]